MNDRDTPSEAVREAMRRVRQSGAAEPSAIRLAPADGWGIKEYLGDHPPEPIKFDSYPLDELRATHPRFIAALEAWRESRPDHVHGLLYSRGHDLYRVAALKPGHPGFSVCIAGSLGEDRPEAVAEILDLYAEPRP